MTTHDMRPREDETYLDADREADRQPIDQDLDGRPDGFGPPSDADRAEAPVDHGTFDDEQTDGVRADDELTDDKVTDDKVTDDEQTGGGEVIDERVDREPVATEFDAAPVVDSDDVRTDPDAEASRVPADADIVEVDAYAEPEQERRDPEAFGPVTDAEERVAEDEPATVDASTDPDRLPDTDYQEVYDVRDAGQELSSEQGHDAEEFLAATEAHTRADRGWAGPERSVDTVTGELLPSDIEAQPVAALWNDESTAGLRGRWQDLQLRFIDDPNAAARQAEALVAEAVEALSASLRDRLNAVDDHRAAGDAVDTEQLRVAVHRYRDLLDRVLSV